MLPTLKKDELWKPVLRMFRKFVRQRMRQEFEINNPLAHGGKIKQNTLKACQSFLCTFDAPASLIQTEFNILALIVILSRCQAKNLNARFSSLQDKQLIYRLKQTYCQLFRENSAVLRRSFFSEALVQLLWPRFIEGERESVNHYLQSLQVKQRQTLIMDTIEISHDTRFNILGNL